VSAARIVIVRDAADPVTRAPSVDWAAERLRSALEARGAVVHLADRIPPGEVGAGVVLGDARAPWVTELLANTGVPAPSEAEALALVPVRASRGRVVLACGADARGLTYAVLELADRAEHGEDPLAIDEPIVQRPANAVRSVVRSFCSEVEDKGWFHDEAFWHRYLSMLACQRFNRFSLTLGLGYNYHRDVTDAYLYFAYPFLLSVPGYEVRVSQLPDEERERNLSMLRFISDLAVARGLDFQLGLWTHAYEWIESPRAHQTIEGLTPETHAGYCRDAVRMLLEVCPAIGGVTFRIHGESGVPEGSWDFWRAVFDGVASCGRRVGIDLHAKGLDERTLGDALGTGLPITVSPKFWAEHMGLPYHQAAIRERERTPREDPSHLSEWHRYMNVSEGSRPFTRYGYADFLREDRGYDVVFRLWPGTQRVLLWGDPAFAAAYGRVASIAGSQGLEWCEPLTFKGREGSGRGDSRTGYVDHTLVPADDWEKYAYTYRLFGRLTYDPDAPADTWRRVIRMRFADAAVEAEAALSSASRILPLVTVAHHPSASNNYYWPELYTDVPIAWSEEGTRPHPYLDTPEPRRFGTVVPLDPEVFSSVKDHVEELRMGVPSGRVSPIDVAAWLDRLAEDALRHLQAVDGRLADPGAEARRWSTDIAIVAALGRFFAGKMRAAVFFELFARTGSRVALRRAIVAYRVARGAWLSAATRAEGAYVPDITFGPQPWLRGHWADRLPAIDADLQDMEDPRGGGRSVPADDDVEIDWLGGTTRVPADVTIAHVPPSTFQPGVDLPLEVELRGTDASEVQGIVARHRPMNQALAYAVTDMDRDGERFVTRIPGSELNGRYPLAYAFVLRDERGGAWRHPSLGPDLTGQPYFIARSERSRGAADRGSTL
jgi:hypothetical protein